MTLNTDHALNPIDLDESLNEYSEKLTSDTPNINQPNEIKTKDVNTNFEISPNEPIYIMTVELGDGNSESIKIYSDSNPEELSYNFCKQHNLDYQSMNYLNSQLTSLIEQFGNLQGMNCIQEVEEEDYVSDRILTSKFLKTNAETANINLSGQIDLIKTSKPEEEKTLNLQNNVCNDTNLVNIAIENLVTTCNGSERRTNDNLINEQKEFNPCTNKEVANIYSKNRIMKNENNLTTVKSNLYDKLVSKNVFLTREYEKVGATKSNFQKDKDKAKEKKPYCKEPHLFSYEMINNDIQRIGKSNSNTLQDKNLKNVNKQNLSAASVTATATATTKPKENIFDRLYKNASYHKFGIFNIESQTNKSSNSKENIYSSNTKINENKNPINIENFPLENINNINQSKSPNSNCTINFDQLFLKTSPTNKSANVNKQILNRHINYGERLYKKNTKLQEETRRKIEFYKRIREEEYNSVFTYKPRINSKSADIIKTRYQNKIINLISADTLGDNHSNYNYNVSPITPQVLNSYDPNHHGFYSAAWMENITNYNTYVEEKLEKLKKKYEKKEEFSFTPEINKNSQKIADQKLKSKLILQLQQRYNENDMSPKLDPAALQNARIEDLYNKWRLRSLKIDKMAESLYSQYTFKPQIINNKNCSEVVNLPFEQRQEFFKKRVEEKLLRVDKSSYGNNNRFNRTIREGNLNNQSNSLALENQNNSQSNPRKHKVNIFYNLYSLAKKYSQEKNQKVKLAEDEIIRNMHSVHTLQPSDHMIQKMKEDSFKKIFRILDSDEDNVISSFYINTSKLDKDVLKILQPILVELKEEQETLNEEEFVRACHHLYEVNYLIIITL